jgi:hypothetical protein
MIKSNPAFALLTGMQAIPDNVVLYFKKLSEKWYIYIIKQANT